MSEAMKPLDLDALERLARAVPKRDWSIEPFDGSDKEIVLIEPGITIDHDDVDHAEAEAISAFIAAANPQTVLRLIAMARKGQGNE